MDDLISKAEVIVVGEVSKNIQSKWKSPNGAVPADLTFRKIIDLDLSIFTDSLILVNQVLKGTLDDSVVRARTFKGQIDNVRFENSSEPSYIVGVKYLLFLHKDAGPTQIVDPGNYIPVGAILGVYKIDAGRAVSQDDEWELDILIGYIKSSQ